MNTDIAVQQSTLDEKMAWSKAMATGDMLPRQYRGNPANLMFACEYADALGIPRINALTSIHVIDGKPTASADLIASLVRKAGHKMRVEGDDTYAEVTVIRVDDPDYVPNPVRWDEAKARKAGKWGSKGPWTNYPAAMLRSRAITEAARMWASDALFGVIYTSEEIGGQVTDDGDTVITAAPLRRVKAADIIEPSTPVVAAVETVEATVADEDDERQDEPEPLSERTRGQLYALFTQKGITDRSTQLAGLSTLLGRELTSRSELTEDDARTVILELQERPDAA